MTVARLLPLLLALGALGCPGDPRDREKTHVLARVGDVEIKDTLLITALAQRGTARIADPTQRLAVATTVLDSAIEEELVLAAAAKSGISVRDDEIDRELRARTDGYPPGTFQRLLTAEQLTIAGLRERVQRRLVQDAFLRVRLAEAPPITEDELRARFDATLKDKGVPEQVRARHILLKTSEEAAHVLAELRGRKIGFEAAAHQYSAAPDAEDGGDLGWFSRGDMPDAFDICFNLESNTVSDPVGSSYGFHIFQVVDRRNERPETFDGARARLEEELLRERQTERFAKLLAELRAATTVNVNREVLERVVAMLPEANAEPSVVVPEEATARALDSHESAIDPVPEVLRAPRPPPPPPSADPASADPASADPPSAEPPAPEVAP
ncbi:MAG: peptidylprolyl isomerase [Deltaproteobacteria bacterium]|nr:peptidylprolyl isomerase [Deltaproteobacteria bacterium]